MFLEVVSRDCLNPSSKSALSLAPPTFSHFPSNVSSPAARRVGYHSMVTLATTGLRQRMSTYSSAIASTSSLFSSTSLHRTRRFSSNSSPSQSPSQQSLPSLLTSHIDPDTLPSPLAPSKKSKTLYEHLASLPNNGVGTRVRQVKWAARGIDIPWGKEFPGPIADPSRRKQYNHLCYWEITKARIKWTGENKTPHGKAWGRLVWRGELERAVRGTQEMLIVLTYACQDHPSPHKARKSA